MQCPGVTTVRSCTDSVGTASDARTTRSKTDNKREQNEKRMDKGPSKQTKEKKTKSGGCVGCLLLGAPSTAASQRTSGCVWAPPNNHKRERKSVTESGARRGAELYRSAEAPRQESRMQTGRRERLRVRDGDAARVRSARLTEPRRGPCAAAAFRLAQPLARGLPRCSHTAPPLSKNSPPWLPGPSPSPISPITSPSNPLTRSISRRPPPPHTTDFTRASDHRKRTEEEANKQKTNTHTTPQCDSKT